MKHFKIKTHKNQKIIKLLLIVVLFIIFLTLVINFYLYKKDNDCHNLKICYKYFCWNIKLAKTDFERKRWLMFVKNLPINEWMLFIFSSEWKYSFWMKNTYITLDIIWLNKNFKVIKKWENASPCIYKNVCHRETNKEPAKYVLEINWWLSKKLNIKTGDYFYILWKESCLNQ